MKVGLYFGSFNPIHNGHLSIAQQMLTKVGFDEVWIVVSPHNPLKQNSELASDVARLAMARLAVDQLNLPIRVSDVEMGLPHPSFTVNTLAKLSADYHQHKFSIIMGSDNVAVIEKWKDYKLILENYPIFFFPRLGDNSDALAQTYGVTKVEGNFLDISSTQIRERIRKNQSIDDAVPSVVRDYLEEYRLYL